MQHFSLARFEVFTRFGSKVGFWNVALLRWVVGLWRFGTLGAANPATELPALGESLYRLSYPGPFTGVYNCKWNIRGYTRTYSMGQSPSWEANWFAASQEIPCILWNPKVHYRTHKRPSPVPVLCQPNPVHIPTSHLLEIHPNIIHPSTPRYPQWSLSLRFPHQDPIRPPLLTHTRHMPSPSHSSRFYTF